MGLIVSRVGPSGGWLVVALALAATGCQSAPAAPVAPVEARPAIPKVVVVGGEARPAIPSPATPAEATGGRSRGPVVQTRPGDLAAKSLAVSGTPTDAKKSTAVASRTPGPTKTTPAARAAELGDGPYPTPTLRPAHPPQRGPVIIPRPQLPVTRDHAANAAGFLRPDSVTPVPFVRYPAPPPEELPEESAP
jgi:hypothetical protein